MTKSILTAVLALTLVGVAAPSQAQHRSGGGGGAAGGRVGGGVAVPRGSVGTRGAVVVGRPFVGSPFFGPRFSFGFYAGYPYYYPYFYPYGYYGAYWGYPGYYPPYGGYGYGGYGVGLSTSYGKVRIVDAPEHAPVYADGYYVGTVDDFNGTFQHLDLEPGAHHVEIRPVGQPVMSFDVNVQPGETITYHAR